MISQASFDALPGDPELQRLGAVRFVDTGPLDGMAVVFFGGVGTSAGACLLTEFARATRERLGLRLISVERNGFGDTPFDAARGHADAVADVLSVLAQLGVARFRIVAISGGGPFAAALAAAVPSRVVSLHLAAAVATAVSVPRFEDASDPRALWEYPADSPVHRIPGFARAAGDEGVRSLGSNGRGAAALAHEWRLLRAMRLPDLAAVSAPAYLYWGSADEIVPLEHCEAWRQALPNVVAVRCYEGEAHDVQYRHWDQILLDCAGLGDRVLVCQDGQNRLVAEDEIPSGASLGLCCWTTNTEAGA